RYSMFKTGALISPPDVRDYSIIPTAVKDEGYTSPYNPIIGKQKESNCTAYSSAYALEAVTGMRLCKGGHYGDREPEHWQGEGRYLREVCDTLHKRGTAKHGDYTAEYEVQKAQDHIKANLASYRAKAAPFKIGPYARARTVSEIQAALRARHAVIFSGACESFNSDKNGTFRMRTPTYGFHAMAIIDWKAGDNRFRCAQSWGTGFGQKGFCFVPFEDVLRLDDIWVITPFGGIAPDPIIRRTLRKDMKGDDVKLLQDKLISLGLDLGKWGADGDFGSATDAATRSFQKRNSLTVDGIVGPKSWAVLDAE
ncbi:MAG TPA: peptidoglycan-binding protein, partial [Feifaniaceae bacterium]|nr:peptidoglycan-binding protein [Feifaniaceae bacterium]